MPPASRRATPPEIERAMLRRWQRTLLIAIPFGALAFTLGWLLEVPSGQATPFDLVGYPIMAAGMLALAVLLALRPATLPRVVATIMVGASAFFVVKLAYVLLLLPPERIQAELTETFYWIPVIYTLGYMIPGVRGGKLLTLLFTATVLAVSAFYAAMSALVGVHWGVIYALIQLNLADTVLLALTFTLMSLKEDHVRAQVQAEAAQALALTDLLTGLPNRATLERELQAALAQAKASGRMLALLFIDLDRFKVINDTLGHEAGDQVLEQVAQRLRQHCRDGDLVARISGDEFILMVRDLSDPQFVTLLAHRLLAALVMPFHVQGQKLSISASIGSSLYPDDADSADALLRHADSAMYKVKKSGKNGFQRFEAGSDLATEKGRNLEKDFKSALQTRQFSLHYQPIFDLRTGGIVKLEALVRWRHPEYGDISPAEFIPVAEDSGFISQLGGWILDEACRQVKAWQRHGQGAYKVAVNVSPLQFISPGFFDSVLHALSKHALPPETLELELTESVVMHGITQVETTLRRLRRLGISIAIDDFGTGYSSLAYLRELPIDVIKIDRSFIRDLSMSRGEPHFALALVQAILSLAAHLDLAIVAEGVETEAQRDLLRALGCHAAQGYFFSKPLPPEALELYLAAQRSQNADTVYAN
jgi:diguanylate cyclase